MKRIFFVALSLVFMFALTACGNSQPTPAPTAVAQATATAEPTNTPQPTNTPEPTATATELPTNTPTNTPEPTFTPTPSPTPIPQILVVLTDIESSEPITEATVLLSSEVLSSTITQTVGTEGTALFVDIDISATDYLITATAPGYQPITSTVVPTAGETEITLALTPGVVGEVIINSVNLRSGPGTAYPVVFKAVQGDILEIVGKTEAGDWVQIQYDETRKLWVSTSSLEVQGNLETVELAAIPPVPAESAGNNSGSNDEDGGSDPETPVEGFDPQTFYDQMLEVRWTIEQAGGLLDRVYNEGGGSCGEYVTYLYQLLSLGVQLEILLYQGSIPAEWQTVYNETHWAINNTLDTSKSIYSLCINGGGVVTELNYGVARQGVNDSLARLIPAINTAAALPK